MEKYKRFTDPATGINPFVPATAVGAAPIARRLLGLLAAPAVFVSLLVAAAIYVVLGAMPFALLGAAAAPLHMVAVRLAGYLALASAAWAKLTVMPYPLKAGALSSSSAASDVHPAAGDAIFANLQSPIDPLVLQVAFPWRPLTFVFPRGTTEPTSTVDADAVYVETSLLGAMARTLTLTSAAGSFEGPPTSSKPLRPVDLAPLQGKAKKAGSPLLVFPEGATTNGRGLLRMPACICDPNQQLLLAGVAYSNDKAHPAPVVPAGTGLAGWLFGHCVAWSTLRPSTADVAVVRRTHRPPVPSSFAGDWATSLQAKLGQAVAFNRPTDKPCRPLGSSAFDKERFLCQWGQYNDAPAATTTEAKPKSS